MTMTEDEWLSGTDPWSMLRAAIGFAEAGRFSHRKLRLFACGSCRHIWHVICHEKNREALDTAERYADGRATVAELAASREVALKVLQSLEERGAVIHSATYAAVLAAGESDQTSAVRVTNSISGRAERRAQADLLRDVFGNPFRVNPLRLPGAVPWLAWQNDRVRRLADAIYAERSFEQLPVLADMLEEAGCDDAAVLDHCRADRPHVPGCWVVDSILGRD